MPMDVSYGFDAAGFEGLNGLPQISDVHNYHAPMGAMAAPIPSIPPAEDIAW
jgi:hypothetical protein